MSTENPLNEFVRIARRETADEIADIIWFHAEAGGPHVDVESGDFLDGLYCALTIVREVRKKYED